MTIKTNISKWTIISVLLFTALLYARALFNDFASWDDDTYILQNKYLRDFSINGIKNIFSVFYAGNYHPLTTIINLFEYKLFGSKPLPYHLLNILLHLLNILLVFKLSEKLSKKKTTAVVVSLLFATHPMHVESVAWISELKDVLYSLFYLLSLLVYMNYINSSYKTKLYICSLLLFVASLLSKSAAVTLPVLLFAIDIYKGRKLNLKLFAEKIPFLLLSLGFGVIAILSQNAGGAINNISFSYNFIEKIFLLSYTTTFYIVKLIAPFSLSVLHYYPDNSSGTLPWIYYASLPFLILITTLIFYAKAFRKEIIFGFLFFLIAISVMLQVVPVGICITSERYTYIPYIGLFYVTGQWLAEYLNKYNRQTKRTLIFLFSLIILAFSFITWKRIAVWKNGEVLFTDVIKKYPENYHPYCVRGLIKSDKGDIEGALLDFNKTLKYKPDYMPALITRSEIRYKLNDYAGAMQDINFAIKKDSLSAEAYCTRGMIYKDIGDINSAMNDYCKAIKLNPELPDAYKNRASLFVKMNNFAEAMNDINMAIALKPDYAEAYSNRGNMKAAQKNYTGSIEDYNHSIMLNPDYANAYYNRGVSRLNIKDTAGACEDWQKAMKLGSDAAYNMSMRYCN